MRYVLDQPDAQVNGIAVTITCPKCGYEVEEVLNLDGLPSETYGCCDTVLVSRLTNNTIVVDATFIHEEEGRGTHKMSKATECRHTVLSYPEMTVIEDTHVIEKNGVTRIIIDGEEDDEE